MVRKVGSPKFLVIVCQIGLALISSGCFGGSGGGGAPGGDGLGGASAPVDMDGDGVPDSEDEFPNDPDEQSDNDNDGIGDNGDTDDDNDGTVDSLDFSPLNDITGRFRLLGVTLEDPADSDSTSECVFDLEQVTGTAVQLRRFPQVASYACSTNTISITEESFAWDIPDDVAEFAFTLEGWELDNSFSEGYENDQLDLNGHGAERTLTWICHLNTATLTGPDTEGDADGSEDGSDGPGEDEDDARVGFEVECL